MAGLDMQGPYNFSYSEIDKFVTKTSPGNYGLGSSSKDRTAFYVRYVGRSDSDIKQELKARLTLRYAEFKFSHSTSARSAFGKECRNYHEFGGSEKLDNKVHPTQPANADWECPVCDIFD